MARHLLFPIIGAMIFLLHNVKSKHTEIRIVLQPRDWVDPSTEDGFFCGIEPTLDPYRLLAEENSEYIFYNIDKTQDPTQRYRTKVMDIITFDTNEKPYQMLEKPLCPFEVEEETDLNLLFLAPRQRQCNEMTFKDYSEEKQGYYPVFITSSGNLTEAINRFIVEAKSLKPFFNNEIPKLCGTKLRMDKITARSREKELRSLFNFIYNSDVRAFDASEQKVCKSIEDTLNSIDKSGLFDTTACFVFKNRNQTVQETDGIARITIVRNCALDKKAVVFVKTDLSGNGGKCSPATEDDVVPLFNAVVFKENEKEVDVILIVKQDNEEEDEECLVIHLKEASQMQRHRRRKRMIKGAIERGTNFYGRLVLFIKDKLGYSSNENNGQNLECQTNPNDKVCVEQTSVEKCDDLDNPCFGGQVCHKEEKTCQYCDKDDPNRQCTDLQLCSGKKKDRKICNQKHCTNNNHKQCSERTIYFVKDSGICESYCEAPGKYGPCDHNIYDSELKSCKLLSSNPDETNCVDYKCITCNDDAHCSHLAETPACSKHQLNKGCKMCTDLNTKLCKEPTPNCDEEKGTCQECGHPEHCKGKLDNERSMEKCRKHKDGNKCVQCLSKDDCAMNQLKQCDKEDTNYCVQCLRNHDCNGLPGQPLCDINIKECIGCFDDNNCKSDPTKPKCDNNQHCVECLASADCTPRNFETCDIPNNQCRSEIRCEAFWWAGGLEPELKILIRNPAGQPTDRVHLHLNTVGGIAPRSHKCGLNVAAMVHTNGYPPHLQQIIAECQNNLQAGNTWTVGNHNSFFHNGPGPARQTAWFFYRQALNICFFT